MSALPPLTNDQAARAAVLQCQIEALQEAVECVTDATAPGVIYCRVNDLIDRRQQSLLAIYRDASAAAAAAAAASTPLRD